MTRRLPGDVLPKGMEVPAPAEPPVTLTLDQVNYVGEIRKALSSLPFDIHVDTCEVHERHGEHPVVLMRLQVRPKEEYE